MAQHEPTQSQNTQDSGDGKADAIAATAIIALVVGAMVYWLKHL